MTQNQTGHFTSFLSHSYIPFFVRPALFDEVYFCLKVVQQRSSHPDVSDLMLQCYLAQIA
jgi:hypothetical protein